jgi:hypothetical protein
MKPETYHFEASMWRYSSEAASWFFVYVSDAISSEIRSGVKAKKIRTKGFAFVPVRVTVGETTWQTTLFPNKEKPYLLSINKKTRASEGIFEGDLVSVSFVLID